MKMMYGLLFDLVVVRINASLDVDSHTASSFIGILDIFGFESLETNSLEQLCINYANEKLQQHFNKCVFLQEQEMYRLEGISHTGCTYLDVASCISMIDDRRSGLFAMLDEECRLPKGSDAGFVAKLFDHGSETGPLLRAPGRTVKDKGVGRREVTHISSKLVNHINNSITEISGVLILEISGVIYQGLYIRDIRGYISEISGVIY